MRISARAVQVKRKGQLNWQAMRENVQLMALYQLSELREKWIGIVRAWGRLGMILNTENRLGLVPHAFHRLIVKINSVHLHV